MPQGPIDKMFTPVVVSQIVDELNAVRAAEQRIARHLLTLAEQGNHVLVYPIEEGRSHVLVWAADTDMDNREVEDALISVQIDEASATRVLEDDTSGNVAEG